MPRPQKKRFICCTPKCTVFSPEHFCETVVMTVDEYETIRLIDLEKDTQEACARQMRVSRTTVQSIYDCARSKLADALVNGKKLLIFGGDVTLCPRCCKKRCHPCRRNETEE